MPGTYGAQIHPAVLQLPLDCLEELSPNYWAGGIGFRLRLCARGGFGGLQEEGEALS